MELYVIRHGESEANAGGYFAGWAQVSLTEKGRRDAAMAGRLLKGLHFDRVYSSDLLRAVQTANIALPNVVPEQVPALREINVGELEYRPHTECVATLGESFQEVFRHRCFTDFGGESHQMQVERVGGFLRMLAETAQEDETVAAFCHAGTLQTMLDYVLHADTSDRSAIAHNGSVSHFRWSNGHWQLVCWNRTESI